MSKPKINPFTKLTPAQQRFLKGIAEPGATPQNVRAAMKLRPGTVDGWHAQHRFRRALVVLRRQLAARRELAVEVAAAHAADVLAETAIGGKGVTNANQRRALSDVIRLARSRPIAPRNKQPDEPSEPPMLAPTDEQDHLLATLRGEASASP